MAIQVLDTFSGGSDGDDLDTHTPDTDVVGDGWNVAQANGLELNGSGSLKWNTILDYAWIDAGISDQLITVNLDEGGNLSNFNIDFRHDDAAYASRNCYEVNWRNAGGADTMRIYEYTNGSSTELIDTAVAFHDENNPHELVISIIGDSIVVKVDGTERLTLTDSTHTTGNSVGIFAVDGSTLTWQDIQVEDAVVISDESWTGANRGIARGVGRGVG